MVVESSRALRATVIDEMNVLAARVKAASSDWHRESEPVLPSIHNNVNYERGSTGTGEERVNFSEGANRLGLRSKHIPLMLPSMTCGELGMTFISVGVLWKLRCEASTASWLVSMLTLIDTSMLCP